MSISMSMSSDSDTSAARMAAIITRRKYFQLGARGQTGKRGDSNDEVESPRSPHRRTQRKISTSSDSDTISDEDGGNNHASS